MPALQGALILTPVQEAGAGATEDSSEGLRLSLPPRPFLTWSPSSRCSGWGAWVTASDHVAPEGLSNTSTAWVLCPAQSRGSLQTACPTPLSRCHPGLSSPTAQPEPWTRKHPPTLRVLPVSHRLWEALPPLPTASSHSEPPSAGVHVPGDTHGCPSMTHRAKQPLFRPRVPALPG